MAPRPVLNLDALAAQYNVGRTTIYNRLRSGWKPGDPLVLKNRIQSADINLVLKNWKR